METLVLPSQDQLSQHQYWHKHSSVVDLFASPRYSKPHRQPDLSSSPSPVSRSIHRTNSAVELFPLPSPVPLSQSSSDAARPATASGRVSHRRASPVKNSTTKGTGKGGKGSKNRENAAAPPAAPPKPRAKMGFVKKEAKKEESPPKIVILQRPASKEAAMLDLAKITGLPLSEVYAKNGLSVPKHATAKDSSKRDDNSVKKHDGAAKASAKPVKAAAPPQIVAVSSEKRKDGGVKKDENARKDEEKVAAKEMVARAVTKKKVAKPATAGVDSTTTKPVTAMIKVLDGAVKNSTNGNNCNNSNNSNNSNSGPFARNFGEAFFPPPLFDEKWAGPAFTNSPPPSSLPIPNFSAVRRPEILAAQAEFARIMDTEAATRGLRRILNLDF